MGLAKEGNNGIKFTDIGISVNLLAKLRVGV